MVCCKVIDDKYTYMCLLKENHIPCRQSSKTLDT